VLQHYRAVTLVYGSHYFLRRWTKSKKGLCVTKHRRSVHKAWTTWSRKIRHGRMITTKTTKIIMMIMMVMMMMMMIKKIIIIQLLV